MSRALLVVDPQCDFIDGSLPVPGAQPAMTALATDLAARAGAWSLKIVTCDWHPWNHSSFTSNGGSWPRHCVAWSPGASIWPDLLVALNETPGQLLVLKKGEQQDTDEYSIFANPAGRAAITSACIDFAITEMDICGLAGDVCVLNTLRDGIGIFGRDFFSVLGAFVPSLDGGKALAEFCALDSLCIR